MVTMECAWCYNISRRRKSLVNSNWGCERWLTEKVIVQLAQMNDSEFIKWEKGIPSSRLNICTRYSYEKQRIFRELPMVRYD